MIPFAFFVCFLLSSEAFDDSPIENRIASGRPIDISSVPYQVSLLLRGWHVCGAAIILPNFVLTAAHCSRGENTFDLSVRAGSSYSDRGGEVVDVVAKKEHEQFNVSANFDCDICILRLSRHLVFGKTVAPIPVVTDNFELPSGAVGIATGWGRKSLNSSLSRRLQQASFTTVDPSLCKESGFELTINMLCMGGFKGQSTCYGDSGGPLAVDGTLVGLTSFGKSIICEPPAVFTKVAMFIPWLRLNIDLMENWSNKEPIYYDHYQRVKLAVHSFIQNVISILLE